jgi:diguanylate cyclase (GGDEF)-like protein
MKVLNLIAWSLLLITAVLIFSYPYFPERRLEVYPSETWPNIYAGSTSETKPEIKWTDETKQTWSCVIPDTTGNSFCGVNYIWNDDEYTIKGRDLSRYDYLVLNFKYQGSAEKLTLFMRNFNNKIAPENSDYSNQYLFTEFRLAGANKNVYTVPLDELKVADWWLDANDHPRQFALPNFENITLIGIAPQNNDTNVDHLLTVKSFTLTGKLIDENDFYLLILSIWMLALFSYLLIQNRNQYAKAQRYRKLKTSLEQENKQLELLTDVDPLTQLLNRRGLQRKLNEAQNGEATNTVLMLLDIDRFKSINDTYGHNIGDIVLATVADSLITTTRHKDIVARWGGEEFCVCCEVEHSDGAIRLAEKIRENVSALHIKEVPELRVTISIGLALMPGMQSFEHALSRADSNLYKAKQAGRNRVVHDF